MQIDKYCSYNLIQNHLHSPPLRPVLGDSGGSPLALQQARSSPGGVSGGERVREFGSWGCYWNLYHLNFRELSDTEYTEAYLLWGNK